MIGDAPEQRVQSKFFSKHLPTFLASSEDFITIQETIDIELKLKYLLVRVD